MKWRFLVPLLLFALLVGFLVVGLDRDPRAVPSPLIGRPAPAFALTTLDDAARTLRRDDLLGRAYLLNVWASWCAACRDEHPHLLAFARDRRVPLYGLNYKDQRADARAWLARFGDPYQESLFDADGRVGIDFGVYGVPETFVIDQQGIVRWKHIGPLTPEVIRGRIEPLLRQLDG
jgi:cytochrome c biogenesis protein CcmG/thiol:disulfide interchange protein DsbE